MINKLISLWKRITTPRKLSPGILINPAPAAFKSLRGESDLGGILYYANNSINGKYNDHEIERLREFITSDGRHIWAIGFTGNMQNDK